MERGWESYSLNKDVMHDARKDMASYDRDQSGKNSAPEKPLLGAEEGSSGPDGTRDRVEARDAQETDQFYEGLSDDQKNFLAAGVADDVKDEK